MSPEERYQANQNLVFKALELVPYRFRYRYKSDLLQEARVVLWKCCYRFDESLNCQLSTFFIKVVRRDLMHWIHQNTLLIRPPQTQERGWYDWNWLRDHIRLGGDLNGVPEQSDDPSEVYEDVVDCLENLEGRDGEVLRYYLLEGNTLESIGRMYNFSKERARQICERATNKLAHQYMLREYGWCFCPNCQKKDSA